MSHSPTHPVESPETVPFKAETRQLLNILIHSLYTEREIFLRELISNASDALTRMDFELLTNRNVVSPEAPLEIRITANAEANTLTIADTGIGMTAAELSENLGTIAHSGARAFIEAAKTGAGKLSDMIGQFGVGFYSAFMIADGIRVTSRSYQPDAEAATWFSTGADTYTIEPADRVERGTVVTLHLKEDAKEFLQPHRLREVIKKHSDFISFPIYIGEDPEQVNRQTAIWRQTPRKVDEKEYKEFYKQLTLDLEEPLTSAHMSVDAPVQMYAILYIPTSPERNLFSIRKEDGLKLYSRKILIQDYCRDLLPDYLRFVQGVVDSEDLPLNVSRESVQSNRVMIQLKKLVTAKVLDMLKKMTQDKPEEYGKFWEAFKPYLKQGAATEQVEPENIYPLLRFHSLHSPDRWISLDQYIQEMKSGQKGIYYVLGDDERSLRHSPHLDLIRRHGYDVLLLADPVDSFVLLRLTKYQEKPLQNVAAANLDLPEADAEEDAEDEQAQKALSDTDTAALVGRFKEHLGDRVADVRVTNRLAGSPARLVDPEGALNPEMQRVYRMLERDFEAPKKVLELNPRHPILVHLSAHPADPQLDGLVVEQLYEDALLIEGLHPDPASMVARIQKIIEAALQ